METNGSSQAPEGYKFSEAGSSGSCLYYNFGDFPFAVSVFAFPAESGVTTDWYVSGRRKIDEIQPSLIMKMTFSIHEQDRWIIEGMINQIWDNYFLDLAFGSAMVSGSLLGDFVYTNPTRHVEVDFLGFHLYAHDRFADLKPGPKISKVERTARWHLLLQSFGIKQTHQIIANYESNFVGLADGSLKTVNTATINQRLQLARKQGLLSQPHAHSTERSGEKQQPKEDDNNENN